MSNAYVTVDTIKGTGALNLAGTAFDSRLRTVAENVSRQIDRYCNRVFYFYTESKTFDGDGSTELFVPDLISVGTLQEDNNNDGTFDTAWASADFLLYPSNANPTADWGRPYTRIQVSGKTGGTQDAFLAAQQNYKLTGTWGYRKVTTDCGLNGSLADGTATGLIFSGSAAGTIEVGMTILIDSEQVYVTGYGGTAGTVERGKNGSTATAHAATADCLIVQYPGPVAEAALIQTARLWKRKDSGFASQIGMQDTGQMTILRGGLDQDVKELLEDYRKTAMGFPI